MTGTAPTYKNNSVWKSTAPTTPRSRRTTTRTRTRTRTRTKRKPPQRLPRRPRPPRPRAATPPAAPVRPVARRAAPLVVRPAAMAARLRLRLRPLPLPTPRPRLTIRSAKKYATKANKALSSLLNCSGPFSLKRPGGRSLYRQTKRGTDQRRCPLQATMSAHTMPSARPAHLLARIAQLIDQRLETLAVLGRLGNNQNRIVAGKRAKHIG